MHDVHAWRRSWRGSGLSQLAWCLRRVISPQTFGYWRRRLSSGDAMLPVVVQALHEAAPVEATQGNGASLCLPSAMSGEALSQWLRVLRAC